MAFRVCSYTEIGFGLIGEAVSPSFYAFMLRVMPSSDG